MHEREMPVYISGWIIDSNYLAQELMFFISLIIHYLVIITFINYAHMYIISLPKSIHIILT